VIPRRINDPHTVMEGRLAAGDGLTLHDHGGYIPGTVLRVSTSGRCVWFKLDVTIDGTQFPSLRSTLSAPFSRRMAYSAKITIWSVSRSGLDARISPDGMKRLEFRETVGLQTSKPLSMTLSRGFSRPVGIR